MTADSVQPEVRSWVDSPLARPTAEPRVRDALGAGFTHDVTGGYRVRDARGFEAGGPADLMAPCSVLAELTGQAVEAGVGRLTDDELVGVLRAARRVASWQQSVELAAVAELAARRAEQPCGQGPQPAERVSAEVAAALTLTSRAADVEVELAAGLARLDAVGTALRRGEIDLARASVFVQELASLNWLRASVLAGRHVFGAGGRTTAQLRQLLRRAVLADDPEASRRRQQSARRDARVETWPEGSGNGAIAGRELPAGRVILADRHIRALARTLQHGGMPGTLEQISAEVFLALLTGQSPQSLLAATGQPDAAPAPAAAQDRTARPAPAAAQDRANRPAPGAAQNPADPSAPAAAHDRTARSAPAAPQDRANRPAPGAAHDPADRSAPAAAQDPAAAPVPAAAHDPAAAPAPAATPDPAAAPAPGWSWPGGPIGTVHLTMPLSTWLSCTDRPGEVAGYGALDAWGCRELATTLSAQAGTRYCLTVTTPDGYPLGHACTGTPPPPPAPAPGLPGTSAGPERAPPAGSAGVALPPSAAAWASGLTMHWLETGACSHPRETNAYSPGRLLGHLIEVRNPTCTAPGCRRPARRCDIDHVVPYDRGGRTCECNTHPACRRHHRLKGSPGWRLAMPQLGALAWRLPHGRTYITRAEPYPI